jgi:cysteine desulfurase / selenocysteine lyase
MNQFPRTQDFPLLWSDSIEYRKTVDYEISTKGSSNKLLVYLDSAASTQKPQHVIDAVQNYYQKENANIHRAVYQLGEISTYKYEQARYRVANFLNAREEREIIFTRGATESINLVAQSFARSHLKAGDEILITHLEHHANIVPWQLVCQAIGAQLKVLPINDHGDLMIDQLDEYVSERTRIMAFSHISNALGTINPIQYLCDYAKKRGIITLVDGAQAIAHTPVDVQSLGCDFYVFSGHKLYAPTGIGVLYGKAELLSNMPPYQGGGDMIEEVYFEQSTYAPIPSRFEAGTPHIAGAVGLAAAIDYLQNIGLSVIASYEEDLVNYAAQRLIEVEGLTLIGTPQNRASVVSFVISGCHAHDIGTLLDGYGIAIRVGHHCAQPVMRRFDITATARISLSLYNSHAEVDYLVESLHKVVGMLR